MNAKKIKNVCVLIVGLSLLNGGYLLQANEDASSIVPTEKTQSNSKIKIERDSRMKTYVIETQVNGKNARLLFDTGATHTTCDRGWVEQNLKDVSLQPIRIPGKTNVKSHVFIFDGEVACFPLDEPRTIFTIPLGPVCQSFNPAINGIIGMDAVENQTFIFSPKNLCIDLAPPQRDSSWFAVPCRTDRQGRFYIAYNANGEQSWLLFDTGSSKSFLPKKVWKEFTKEREMHATDVNGKMSHKVFDGKTKDFVITPQLTVKNYTPSLTDNPKDYLFGIDLISQFEFYFTETQLYMRPTSSETK